MSQASTLKSSPKPLPVQPCFPTHLVLPEILQRAFSKLPISRSDSSKPNDNNQHTQKWLPSS